jgi:hypothetical protein
MKKQAKKPLTDAQKQAVTLSVGNEVFALVASRGCELTVEPSIVDGKIVATMRVRVKE